MVCPALIVLVSYCMIVLPIQFNFFLLPKTKIDPYVLLVVLFFSVNMVASLVSKVTSVILDMQFVRRFLNLHQLNKSMEGTNLG